MHSETDLCFVYGTLRQGHGNHHVMRNAGGQYIGRAVSVEPFPLVFEGLPYLLDMPGQGEPVSGEVYKIPKKGWEPLDRLEGHPNFYRRRVEHFIVEGVLFEAWVYFLARESTLAKLAEVAYD